MPDLAIRTAANSDIPQMVELLMRDAMRRRTLDPVLWAIAGDAEKQVEKAVRYALEEENQPFRQKWLVAEGNDALVGLVHSMLLPVPPIYAGGWGDPGLLLPDSFVSDDAPSGAVEALVGAAEADLRDAGAQLLLASHVTGNEWLSCFEGRGYEPLTRYLAKVGLEGTETPGNVRPASEEDLSAIVERSAGNRAVLAGLDAFWTPHTDADARFANWMKRSLSLPDRDMLVGGPPGSVEGYIIAQPASRLHFPPAHDISATGVIDDYYHEDFSIPSKLRDSGDNAANLLQAAEAAFHRRGIDASFVVCPAAWTSKISLLEDAGYATAMTWMVKR